VKRPAAGRAEDQGVGAFYDLGTDARPTARLADAFAELNLVV
jgi:hypothetical protein